MEKQKIDLTEIMGRFGNEGAARDVIEKLRWPDGPVCPHCGCQKIYRLTPNGNSGIDGTEKTRMMVKEP